MRLRGAARPCSSQCASMPRRFCSQHVQRNLQHVVQSATIINTRSACLYSYDAASAEPLPVGGFDQTNTRAGSLGMNWKHAHSLLPCHCLQRRTARPASAKGCSPDYLVIAASMQSPNFQVFVSAGLPGLVADLPTLFHVSTFECNAPESASPLLCH